MNKHIVCTALLGGLLSGGCMSSFDPPKGYVIDPAQKDFDLKAVSARGNVIALSSRSNVDSAADLAYWSDAIEYQKVDLDGLKLAGRESIKSKGGLEGTLFQFEAGEGQGKTSYLVALYVTPRQIFTIEATGPAEALAKEMDKLKESMASLR